MIIQSIFEENGRITVTIGNAAAVESETFVVSAGRARKLSTPLAVGTPVDESLYTEIEHAAAVTSAVELAARILAVSDKSSRALRQKLIEKKVPPDVAEEAVAFMLRRGYLNEYRAAMAYARSAVETKLHGKRRISGDLYARGYAESTIRQVINEISDEECLAAMQKYLDKSFAKSYNDDKDPIKRQQYIRRVVTSAGRMGHSPSAAVKYIKKIMGN